MNEVEDNGARALASSIRDIHRIGGASIDNLRLKPREEKLDLPGISVLRASTPEEATQQMKTAFPKAKLLHALATVVASTSEEQILAAGFDMMPVPSLAFPNHFRIVHPHGVAGFADEQLLKLAKGFQEVQLTI